MPNRFSCIIIDDEQDAIELLQARIGLLYKNINITASFLNWTDALGALRQGHFDLLLLDINMPGKSGIDLLKLLPNLDSEIIFVTAHDEYALEAFGFTPSGYILKPVDDRDLAGALDKALERMEYKRLAKGANGAGSKQKSKIGIPNNHGVDYINTNDIIYLESTNKCTRIVTTRQEYISSLNLGKIKEMLDETQFYQIHRSYIVSLNCILRYESSGIVVMTNKMEIPVSRSVRNEFLDLFTGNS